MTVQRGGETLALPVTPAPSPKDGTGRIGIQLTSNNEVLRKVAANPVQALSLAAEECAQLTGTVLKGAWGRCRRQARAALGAGDGWTTTRVFGLVHPPTRPLPACADSASFFSCPGPQACTSSSPTFRAPWRT